MYYPADIHNALLAAEQATKSTAAAVYNKAEATGEQPVDSLPSAFIAGYLTGYRAALATLALAFGLATFPESAPLEQKPAFLIASSGHHRR